MRFRHLLLIALFAVGLVAAQPAFAQEAATPFTGFSLVPACARVGAEGPLPDLDCALIAFKGISFFLFGISGSVALLIFVYGGFLTLTSGFADNVKKGKELIKNAVIGLFIIMISAYAVDYFIGALTKEQVQIVGAVCGKNGVYTTEKETNGNLKCETVCAKISGYQCVQGATYGNCLDIITSCGDGSRCCAP